MPRQTSEREVYNNKLRAVRASHKNEENRERTAVSRVLPSKARRFRNRGLPKAAEERGTKSGEGYDRIGYTNLGVTGT